MPYTQHYGLGTATGRVRADIPLSYSQQRIWFLDQMEASRPRHNISVGLRLSGRVNKRCLQDALGEIVRRHESLRTVVSAEDAVPVQVIRQAGAFQMLVVELSPLSPDECERRALELAAEEAQKAFDVEQGPLFRATLIDLTNRDHILVLVLHHIVADGWSLGILLNELSILYSAFLDGQLSPLPEPEIQYGDFAVAQQGKASDLDEQLLYWKRRLRGAAPVLQLPTDFVRPPVYEIAGNAELFSISGDLANGLRQLSLGEGATLYMGLLTAFQVLLARYSGSDDIIVGSPTAGRNRTALENVIGCFINTLVLRTDVSANPSFRELLRNVKDTALEAYAHQDVPFERLVAELQLDRDPSTSPVFQVLFDLHNSPPPLLNLPGIAVQPIRLRRTTSAFDLSLVIEDGPKDLAAAIEYNTRLFQPGTARRIAEHLVGVIREAVAYPERRIREMRFMTSAEEEDLLVLRNRTAADYPRTSCVHDLIESQTAKTPEAIAARFGSEQITYRELDNRSNQLAHHLQELGVGADRAVGIYMERSIEMLVALLGTMKAGGAFLPLDPSFPRERIAFMLADAGARVVLTLERLAGRLPEASPQVLSLDRERDKLSGRPTSTPPRRATADNLAYVIYTSGSTGRPKGVLIPHFAFVNYLAWCVDAYGAADGKGAPVQSTIAADAIFPSLFAPLLAGTTVHLMPDADTFEHLAALLTGGGPLSLMKITPSQLEVLNQYLGGREIRDAVRTLVVGAEALRGDILSMWRDRAPDTVLLNEYGPTETVVGCSIYRVPVDQYRAGPVPIGLPIANMTFYVLDSRLQPVPVGVEGELYIGGDGVAWGYLNRPELTASTFVPDPFAGRPGSRMYKTGDLVRYMDDRLANIQFLGRRDDQVKIRGYRVELAEVEAALITHPAVREAVVIARGKASADRQLVAYIVYASGPRVAVADLQKYLRESLPEYMVPQSIVPLESFPLMAHGKVNRALLPAPEVKETAASSRYAPPRDAVETFLVSAWADLLGVERVGVDDNFFELGGHSLLAVRLVSKVQRQFGVNVPLRSIFEAPTVAGLAERIASLSGTVVAAVALEPRHDRREYDEV